MDVVRSKNGVPIRLNEERWAHIILNHAAVAGLKESLLETVEDPDVIHKGDEDELLAARLYPETQIGEKWLVVAYKETSSQDGFIITAYLTRRLSGRKEELWRRS